MVLVGKLLNKSPFCDEIMNMTVFQMEWLIGENARENGKNIFEETSGKSVKYDDEFEDLFDTVVKGKSDGTKTNKV